VVVLPHPGSVSAEPKANATTPAISLYWDGNLVRGYSQLEIARRPYSCTAPAYDVIQSAWGYGRRGRDLSFDLLTIDSRVLNFDVKTGELLSK